MNDQWKLFLLKASRPLILVLLFVFFSYASDTFWSIDNWDNIANIILQQAPFSVLLATAMTTTIILNSFDLSMGASVAFISCICGLILRHTGSTVLAVAGALFLGGMVGFTNGFLTARIGIPSFVATYAMKWVLNGFALVLLGGKQIYDFGPGFRKLFISSRWTFLMIMVAVILVLYFVMKYTVFGHQVYATGHNADAARISGIRTEKVTIAVYMISGLIVGLTAVLYIANLGTAEPNIGSNFPINAIAASLIGGTAIGGGSGSVGKALVGTLILLVLQNGMIQCGVPSVWQQVIVGSVIILSIMMERVLQKISKKMEA